VKGYKKYYSVSLKSVFLVMGIWILSGCSNDDDDGTSVPRVTPSSSTSASSTQPSSASITYPPPNLPTSPACNLLSVDDVRNALGGGAVQKGFGNDFPGISGPAGPAITVDRISCSWQQGVGTDPGRILQVSVDTAKTWKDAEKYFTDLVNETRVNTAPTFAPESVDGVGVRGVRLPEWIFAIKDVEVVSVSITPDTSANSVPPEILTSTARLIAGRLNW
jgi:hypothetical protein